VRRLGDIDVCEAACRRNAARRPGVSDRMSICGEAPRRGKVAERVAASDQTSTVPPSTVMVWPVLKGSRIR
jgi:hypothetical protein